MTDFQMAKWCNAAWWKVHPLVAILQPLWAVEQIYLFICSSYDFIKTQLCFRAYHSTETALIITDSFTVDDRDDCSVWILANFCAAFDTADHNTLVNSLENWVGLSDTALNFFKYLSKRKNSVVIGSVSSGPVHASCCVSQGSLLGSSLFSILIFCTAYFRLL